MLDLSSLQTSFKGDLCTPDHPDYEQAIVRWANNAQKRAQVVAFVKDAPDVALAIAYARENKLQIAIRGGAHSTAGASSSEGLVIDLSRYMRTVTVDAEKRLAYVGGGAVWGDVDSATIPHGLATAAGTVNHVRCLAVLFSLMLTLITDWSWRVGILVFIFDERISR